MIPSNTILRVTVPLEETQLLLRMVLRLLLTTVAVGENTQLMAIRTSKEEQPPRGGTT
jgi:hypothetical protein